LDYKSIKTKLNINVTDKIPDESNYKNQSSCLNYVGTNSLLDNEKVESREVVELKKSKCLKSWSELR